MPVLLEFGWRQVSQRGVSTFGVVVAKVLDQRLLCLGAGPEVFSVHAFDLNRAILADSIGALSQQSPLRLMDTVMPRALSTLR